MKIVDVEILEVELKLATPYTIAYETIDKTVNIFIKISTNIGLTGFGCAAPDLEVTGETSSSVIDCLDGQIRDELIGQDPLRLSFIMEHLKKKRSFLFINCSLGRKPMSWNYSMVQPFPLKISAWHF